MALSAIPGLPHADERREMEERSKRDSLHSLSYGPPPSLSFSLSPPPLFYLDVFCSVIKWA